MNVCQRSI